MPTRQCKIPDRPLTPALLERIGMYESLPPRAPGYTPGGDWQGAYRI